MQYEQNAKERRGKLDTIINQIKIMNCPKDDLLKRLGSVGEKPYYLCDDALKKLLMKPL